MDHTIDIVFYRKILSAFQGRKQVGKIWKLLNTDHVLCVIQYTKNRELVKDGEMAVRELFRKKRYKRVYVFYEAGHPMFHFDKRIVGIPVTKRELSAILHLYCMYCFSSHVVVLSFSKPDSNKLGNLIASGVLTRKEAVRIGLFGLDYQT